MSVIVFGSDERSDHGSESEELKVGTIFLVKLFDESNE